MAEQAARQAAAFLVQRALRLPWARVALVAGNLVPLAGVMLWGWDAFLLLILYWMETVVIAFWTFVRMAAPTPAGSGSASIAWTIWRFVWPPLLSALLSINTGVFIAAHLAFLWILFSGNWGDRTGGLAEFLRYALLGEGLWLPLLIMFVARGTFVFVPVLSRLLPRLCAALGLEPSGADEPSADTLMSRLTLRVFTMQIVIIFGGWFAMTVGSLAPLILLILAKTIADWRWQAERGAPRAKVDDGIGRYRIKFAARTKK